MKKSITNYELYRELGELKQISISTLEQTKKTNGRVTELEGRMEGVDVKLATEGGFKEGVSASKKQYSKSRMAVIGTLAFILGSVIVPIVAAYIQTGK